MSEVVEVDFGKELRGASRAYCRLTGIVEKFEEEFARDPRKFLRHAQEEIVRLKMQIEECELKRACSDEQHAKIMQEMADMAGNDPRRSFARRSLGLDQ